MPSALGLDLKAKKQRTRGDYVYLEEYRSRWNDNDMVTTSCRSSALLI